MIKRRTVGLVPESACEPVESGCEKVPLEHFTNKSLHCLKHKKRLPNYWLSVIIAKQTLREHFRFVFKEKKMLALMSNVELYSLKHRVILIHWKKNLKVVKYNRLQLDTVM